MLTGVTDPVGFLDNSGCDWEIACAVIEMADELHAERRKGELEGIIKALGESVGYRVAEQLGRMFR